ncbi:hypothetical protein F0562_005885 [Nyssa sinensis]|uniref:Prefoldin subunit 3 n=1 Tax=Nyssa sinensis TaxID=561372 RepID=A0A5J5AQ60_9ASTE|nr:hypothetical protein F0562_005885 [Nyssa sinensis]
MKLLAQQRDLQAKIPDIEKCLDVVATLQAKKATGEALIADFEVSEGIYSRAHIEDTDSVCLWLGANVMLEYSCEEATALLQKNLENAKASLEVLVADLQFLRDQVTITQVTIALKRWQNLLLQLKRSNGDHRSFIVKEICRPDIVPNDVSVVLSFLQKSDGFGSSELEYCRFSQQWYH